MDPYTELHARINIVEKFIWKPLCVDEGAAARRIGARAASAPRYRIGVWTDEDGERHVVVRSAIDRDPVLMRIQTLMYTGMGGLWRGGIHTRSHADPSVRYHSAEDLGLSAFAVQAYLETQTLCVYIPTWWRYGANATITCGPHTADGRMRTYLCELEPRVAAMAAHVISATEATEAIAHRRRRHALAAFGARRGRISVPEADRARA